MRLFILFSVLVLAGVCVSADSFTIDGNRVYVNDSNVYFSASPHTILESNTVYVDLISKKYEGNIDFIFGVDSEKITPKNAYVRVNKTQQVVKNYTCGKDPREWYNYTTNPKVFNCYLEIRRFNNFTQQEEISNELLFSHFFNYSNITINTAYWYEDEPILWETITPDNVVHKDYGGMNKWFVFKNLSIVKDKQYTVRGDIELKYGKAASKYFACIKPSDLTLNDAIAQNKYYCLDPWWNTSWGSSMNITVGNVTTAMAPYTLFLKIPYKTGMNTTYGDLRFTNSTDSELPYYIIGNTSAEVYVFVKLNAVYTTQNTSVMMYYNNPSVFNKSSGDDTFKFFDHFYVQNLTKWAERCHLGGTVCNGQISYTNAQSGLGYGYVTLTNPGGELRQLRQNTDNIPGFDMTNYEIWSNAAANDVNGAATMTEEMYNTNTYTYDWGLKDSWKNYLSGLKHGASQQNCGGGTGGSVTTNTWYATIVRVKDYTENHNFVLNASFYPTDTAVYDNNACKSNIRTSTVNFGYWDTGPAHWWDYVFVKTTQYPNAEPNYWLATETNYTSSTNAPFWDFIDSYFTDVIFFVF